MNEYPDDIDPKMMEYSMDKFIADVEEALKQEKNKGKRLTLP